MWLVLGIMFVVFMAIVGWLLIYSGSADIYEDKDSYFEKCWDCQYCSRFWGICKLTNAHVRKGQKCNLNEELERRKKIKESLKQ